MREMYTLELIRLVEELNALEGFYIDQFYETEKNKFRLKLSKKGEKANLQSILPYSLNLTNTVEIKEDASDFSIAVRKRISGFKITRIEQYNNDRIILIRLEKADAQQNLIFEMFGKGNLIITDSNMKILVAYKVHVFKDRAVKPGSLYVQPKNQAVNLFDSDGISAVIKGASDSDKEGSILHYLAKRIGIGLIYIEEAMGRSGLTETSKIKELTEKSAQKLSDETNIIIKECTKTPVFFVYKKDGVITDFSLCKLSKYADSERLELDSLESCLDMIYENVQLSGELKSEEEEKTRASIKKQEQILEEIDQEIEENRKSGEQIINNMHEINAIIESARSKKNPTVSDLSNPHGKIEVLSVNTKNKSIKIRIKEEDINA